MGKIQVYAQVDTWKCNYGMQMYTAAEKAKREMFVEWMGLCWNKLWTDTSYLTARSLLDHLAPQCYFTVEWVLSRSRREA